MEPPDYGDVDRMEGSGDLSENVEGRTLTDLVANLIGGGLAMGTAVFQGSDPSTVALRNGAYTGAANDSAMEASSGPGYDQSSSSLATEAASTSRGAGHESDGSIQTPCRHGKACSHQSASHRARFSHPDDDLAARISNSNSKTEKPDNSSAVFANGEATDSADSSGTDGMPGETGCFVCNECGLGFASVRELRLHMVRKTAWSNQGLIGCRVSCLVDNREWHEGLVTQVRMEVDICHRRHSSYRIASPYGKGARIDVLVLVVPGVSEVSKYPPRSSYESRFSCSHQLHVCRCLLVSFLTGEVKHVTT